MLSIFSRKTPEKTFISLVISEGTVAASLWKASSSGQSVLEHAEPLEWNSEAPQSLIDASDVVLEHLGPQVNSVKEVLLGLPESWSSGQSIASDKKSLLQSIAKQLNLKSVGFVVVPEAIAALFRDREKTGLNALLIYVSNKTVQTLLLLHGKAEGSAKVGRSESLTKDVIEACARGEFKNIPSRILLASQDLSEAQLTSAQQELQATEWKEGLFLQHPRVDPVPPQMILDAVSLSGGKEVALALGILKGDRPVGSDESEDEQKQPAGFGFKPVGEAQEEETVQEEAEEGAAEEEEDGKVDVGLGEVPKRHVPKVLIILFGILAALGALLVLAYFSIGKMASAKVEVVIKTQPIKFDQELTIDANASETNAQANILKASLRTKEVSDTSEALTSGSKTIGDKAKGEVTIYNRTTVGDKLFKAGTILKLDDKVQFSLDADINVPLGNKDNGYVGKATVTVTAVNIGAESNIAKGTELTVGGFDKASYVATSNADFTGGSSRKVQVVSDADQKKLADTLYAQLKQKALNSFTSESAPGENVVLSDNVAVTKKQFSDDIGKEVKSFTLTMTVSATAIIYTDADITAFATAKLASQIPQGAVLKSENTDIEVKEQKTLSDTKSQIFATISSMIIPAFDAKQFAEDLSGKSLEDAYTYLNSRDDLVSYRITSTPYFAFNLLRRLPAAERITVESKVE